MKKAIIFLSTIIVCMHLSSCFSIYPIQKKYPCEESSTEEKIQMIQDAYNSRMRPRELKINEDGVRIGSRAYDFVNVKYVRAKKKPGPFFLYQRYWIQIKEFNGDLNEIYLWDHSVMEKANNALMCLTDLQETNGRPQKAKTPSPKKEDTSSQQKTNSSNKYDDLEKLKKLLDTGAITQEEYDKEKKLILSR